jgi:hypothetical protein
MATGQTILTLMEVLNNELQLQPSEPDVVRGLAALNAAQDYFESLVSSQVELLGDTSGTITTTANVEYTAYPTGLLRLDKLQFISPTTSRPAWDLSPLFVSGGHAFANSTFTGSVDAPGQPTRYFTDGSRIYWTPLPDATYTVRWYGFQVASDITAAGTFTYPDAVMLPLASFAVRLMKEGVGDAGGSITEIADRTFAPVIKTLGSFRRDGARPFQYTQLHTE